MVHALLRAGYVILVLSVCVSGVEGSGRPPPAHPTAWLNGTSSSSGPVSCILLLLSTAHSFCKRKTQIAQNCTDRKQESQNYNPNSRTQKPGLLTTVILYPSGTGHTPGKQWRYEIAEVCDGSLTPSRQAFLMWSMLGVIGISLQDLIPGPGGLVRRKKNWCTNWCNPLPAPTHTHTHTFSLRLRTLSFKDQR